jgi:lysophospholipase L1-like esterase
MSDALAPLKLAAAILAGSLIAGGALSLIAPEDPERVLPPVDLEARVLWIGDSITRRAPWTTGQILGLGAAECWELERVADQLHGSRAELVVLNCGANDLVGSDSTPAEIADAVSETLAALSRSVPDAAALVVGVLPAASIDEDERAATNAMLATLEAEGVLYVAPPDRLDTVDGIHPSAEGYRQLDAVIGPVVAELVSP